MIVGVISGKGGVGKTTVAINLATAITRLGKQILLVDGNFDTPHVSLYLGKPDVESTIRTVIRDENLGNSLMVHSCGLRVVSGDISDNTPITGWDLNRLQNALNTFDGPVFLDFPAGIKEDLLSIVDSVIVVTTPDLIAVTDAYKTIKFCRAHKKPILGVIINRYTKDSMMNIQSIQGMLEENILGVLPEEYAVTSSIKMRHPVVYSHPHTRISKAVVDIARHLTGYNEQIFTRLRGISK